MISVIIPTYNEEKALPDTLRHALAQQGENEIIVVDGGSGDRTCDIVRGERGVRLMAAGKGRASQMNAGAAQATGEWLLFLHADTRLPGGALARLNALEEDHRVQAGGFWHRFSGDDWRLRLISSLDNIRCRYSRIIYGDQALFVRRALFERLGGFPDQPILEDVAFGEKLIRVTTPILLAPPVITDSRKFVAMGIWRSFARVLLIILHVECRLPILPRVFFQDIR
ncbi:MAG TPA: TIGR04283 family arsenosugar biosynthesis glycosyltransferase [Nitrospiraceae bacterium]|nr:TIGR04283 family arsenosugar biosynthesis glycosyltransferase [Nitrospiraceae bacterium]